MRRSNQDIRIRILEEAARNDGIKKCRLMSKVGLNSAQTKGYLSDLERMRFIELKRNGNGGVYQASEKGKGFLKEYKDLMNKYGYN